MDFDIGGFGGGRASGIGISWVGSRVEKQQFLSGMGSEGIDAGVVSGAVGSDSAVSAGGVGQLEFCFGRDGGEGVSSSSPSSYGRVRRTSREAGLFHLMPFKRAKPKLAGIRVRDDASKR